MAVWSPDLAGIEVAGSPRLVVGWRRARSIEGGRVKLGREVAEALRGVCRTYLDLLPDLEPKDYSADAALDPEEYLVVPDSRLDPANPVLGLVGRAPTLPSLDAGTLPGRPLVLYAIVLPTRGGGHAGFLRKMNPFQGARRGRLFTVLEDALVRLETPVFVFDDRVDMLVLPGGLVVTNLTAFELLFRGEEVLVERLPEFVAYIAAHLPIADEATKELEVKAARDSRLRRRLLALHERGHLSTVTIDAVRKEAKAQGLDPKKLIKSGKLVLEDVDAGTLLKLLNEDLFTGGLSGVRFAADRKSTR
jgi:hypothetical protein